MGKPVGVRRLARIAAFQALYSWEDAQPELESLLQFGWMDKKPDKIVRNFASLLVAGTLEHRVHIDKTIKGNLKNWSFERLSKVDLAILRIGVYSILFQPDIPASVSIDEAIEIAKQFGSPDSYRFVNGVLDGVLRSEQST